MAKAGTERHLLNLADNLDKHKFDVTICCLFEVGEIDNEYKNADFKLLCLNKKNVYDFRVIIDLYKFIKKEKFDIVHTYLFGFHYLATIVAQISHVPVVISSRRELATWKKWHHHMLENLGNIFTDRVVACSVAVREFSLRTENLSLDKVITIYNGISLNAFHPRPKNIQILNEFGLHADNKIIGMVANFSPDKDHRTMLKAVAEVKKTYPQIKCLLAGVGYLRKKTEKETTDLNLEKNVIFTGKRDDIEVFLSVMDIFVLTSLIEGLPNVILEAMACGLPIVATNVGGIPEAVEDGRSGILVKPQDNQAVADAIIKLLEDENLRKEMGRRGRETLEQRFKLERMIKDYENLYESLLYS